MIDRFPAEIESSIHHIANRHEKTKQIIEELRKEKADFQKRREKLEEYKAKLKSFKENLVTQKAKFTEEHKSQMLELRDQEEAINNQKLSITQRSDSLKNNRGMIEKNKEIVRNRISSMQKEIEHIDRHLGRIKTTPPPVPDLTFDIEMTNRRIKEVDSSISMLTNSLSKHQDVVNTSVNRIADLETKKSITEKEITRKKREKHHHKQIDPSLLNHLEDTARRAQFLLNSLEKRVSKLKERTEEIDRAIDATSKKTSNSRAVTDELISSYEDLLSKFKPIDTAILWKSAEMERDAKKKLNILKTQLSITRSWKLTITNEIRVIRERMARENWHNVN